MSEIKCIEGQLDVVKFLIKLKINVNACGSSSSLKLSAANGHLHVVKYLSKNFYKHHLCNSLVSSATNRHFHIVKYLIQKFDVDGGKDEASVSSASNGNLI